MADAVHIDSTTFTLIGGLLAILLSVIAYFLDRLIKQFDGLSTQFATLNNTMLKIDRDLSGDVGVLKAECEVLKERIDDLDPMWDRMRKAENDITAIRSGGCGKCSLQ